VTRVNGVKVDLGLHPAAGGSTFSAEVTLASGARRLSIQALDAAGNLGPLESAPVR
jgi:hypothetical protein